jgi:(R,R)-butanediol dehydrogenase/meso-butanediol dehydrogenase/diacetyl reductase
MSTSFNEDKATMKAARIYGEADVRVEVIPSPPTPGPWEAVVSPIWSGLCGTDVKEYIGHGGSFSTTPHPLTGASVPLILGHEFSARVVAIGSKIDNVQVGDEVAVMPLIHCGHCLACSLGRYTQCEIKAWTGLSDLWGGMGEYALVQSYQLSPLDGIGPVAGAVIEPAAVALNSAVRSNVGPGSVVFIAGAGAIGILTLLAAKALGASTVYLFETNPDRAAYAASLGAEVIPTEEADNIADYLHAKTGGLGVDVAIDCAGFPPALTAAIASVRPGGTVGIPAVHPGPTMVDVRAMTRNDLTLVGSVGYTQDIWERTVLMVRSGVLPVEQAVTSKIDLDDIVSKGFEVLAKPSSELKILVRVGE